MAMVLCFVCFFYGRAWGLGEGGRKSVGFGMMGFGVGRRVRGGGRGWPARTGVGWFRMGVA